MSNCLEHLYEYYSHFAFREDELQLMRKWHTCTCYCPHCNVIHNCFRPEYWVEADFKDTNIPWCCMNRSCTDKTYNCSKPRLT